MKKNTLVLAISTLLVSGSGLSAESLGPAAAIQAAPQLVIATPEPSAVVTTILAVLGVVCIAWRLRARLVA